MNDYLAYRITYSDELYHYGIKGQKWGLRRYQKPNGRFTEEGKIRYGVDPKTGKASAEGKKLLRQDIENELGHDLKKSGSLGIGVSTASAVAAGIAWSKGILSTTTAIGAITVATVAAGASTASLFLGKKYVNKQKGGNS